MTLLIIFCTPPFDHQGRHAEAMTVWGEQVLPLAPAAFWNLFVERLRRANKLNLLVKWLPFNDRSKARPRMARPVCCKHARSRRVAHTRTMLCTFFCGRCRPTSTSRSCSPHFATETGLLLSRGLPAGRCCTH